ncbi:coiled-coil domain-containing protein 115 isoform X1 [Coffea eugenioides]|uniref:coiled-coil domain-containing protein 115 isoform X1 n=1 Tax=Coffea eugenioides TaxID=49369 RepID=UPI000F60C5B8|nr:coiled-coil domain-containing protein 115 isoform X1 [Coffea eugenioides]XP_027169723.1 coiled-coil domain-containing protein 115 isoform X1 [Coffea eugenioides]
MGEDEAIAKFSEDQNDDGVSESKAVPVEDKESINDKNVEKFLDSMDDYLILVDSLSSILRQGWLELASARHSMGASRISASSYDMKYHSAATTLQLQHETASSDVGQPHFVLRKWESSDSPKKDPSDSPKRDPCEAKLEEDKWVQSVSSGLRIRTKGTSESSESREKKAENTGSPPSVEGHAQKERLKALSMFGALAPPKLRAAQLSFETALETLADIANVRASLLRAYEQVQKEMESPIQ